MNEDVPVTLTPLVHLRTAVIALILVAGCSRGVVAEDVALNDLLPPGVIDIEFMEFAVSERLQEITQRWQTAIAGQPAWFAAYAKSHVGSGGGPLPYHTNFGITKSEYKELQSEDVSKSMRPRGIRKQLEIVVLDSVVQLRTPGWDEELPALSSVSINLENRNLCAYGKQLGVGRRDEKREGGGIYGPWQGYLWDHKSGDIAGFANGKPDADLERIELELVTPFDSQYAYFRLRRRTTNNGVLNEEHILFRYELAR